MRALIIDAGVRDTHTLRGMGFPVWSRAISAQGTIKETLGSVNLPIICAGQLVNPGDVVVADDDGVVIVRRVEVAKVVEASRERADLEDHKALRLAKGEPSKHASASNGRADWIYEDGTIVKFNAAGKVMKIEKH